MFTGIVESAISIQSVEPQGGITRLTLDLSPLPEAETIKIGDSIALNGCCLTVAELAKNGPKGPRATFEAIPETLRLTNLGDLKPGGLVNVERALRFGSRMDGHMVQGHVDQVGAIGDIVEHKGERRLRIQCGEDFARQCVLKGSVCLDGISLTIAALDRDSLTVAIIPHTWAVTNLASRVQGQRVNLEADVIGKYVLAQMGRMFPKGDVGEDTLRRAGFI